MFGAVEEISLCGRKKNGDQFLADYSPLGNVAWRVDRPKTRNRERERERAKVRSKVYKRAGGHGGSRPKCPFRVMEAEASAPEAREFLVLEGCSVVPRERKIEIERVRECNKVRVRDDFICQVVCLKSDFCAFLCLCQRRRIEKRIQFIP
jgi:hypothetical protein